MFNQGSVRDVQHLPSDKYYTLCHLAIPVAQSTVENSLDVIFFKGRSISGDVNIAANVGVRMESFLK